jgi:chromatin structure-remodeling complex subunit RSC9
MGPSSHPDLTTATSEYMAEYNGFLDTLAAFHEKRGTEFVREPRVGSRAIDLLKLYKVVMAKGGYDRVSDEKLAWRKMGNEFNLGTLNHLPALAFSLKTVYYRNLAAYEITTVHGKEPPPKEILEYQTAKGGSLLTRTLENFRPRKETTNDQSEASGDDGTPARVERNGSEETPGSGGRATRGLRQAPPQR